MGEDRHRKVEGAIALSLILFIVIVRRINSKCFLLAIEKGFQSQWEGGGG